MREFEALNCWWYKYRLHVLIWIITLVLLLCVVYVGWRTTPGAWFIYKMTSYQYRKSHCGDKTILRPSYLHNGISYTGKTASLYWIRTLIRNRHITISPYVTETGIFPKKCHNCWGHGTLHCGASEVMVLIMWDDRALSSTMMTSSNRNIFRVTGSLWGEIAGHQWIPLTQASDPELWCFLLSAPEQTVQQTTEMPVIWDAIALTVTSL